LIFFVAESSGRERDEGERERKERWVMKKLGKGSRDRR
jgi:hypothetical protein